MPRETIKPSLSGWFKIATKTLQSSSVVFTHIYFALFFYQNLTKYCKKGLHKIIFKSFFFGKMKFLIKFTTG